MLHAEGLRERREFQMYCMHVQCSCIAVVVGACVLKN